MIKKAINKCPVHGVKKNNTIVTHKPVKAVISNSRKELINKYATTWKIEESFWSSTEALKAEELTKHITENHESPYLLAGTWETAYFNYQGSNGWNHEELGEIPELEPTDYIKHYYADALDDYKEEYYQNCQNYGRPINARTRYVWFDPNNNRVIKMFINDEGEISNNHEITVSQEDSPYIIMAKTEPYGDTGFCIQSEKVQEYVYSDHPDYPEWADYVDCGQVGKTKDGKIVAYDL